MEPMNEQPPREETAPQIPQAPQMPEAPAFPTGRREAIFGILILIFGLMLGNSILYGGFRLGFAVSAVGGTACAALYLLGRGGRLGAYPGAVLALCLIIMASFARSDDGFVKFVMVCFLLLGTNLTFCLLAGRNRYAPGGVASLLDGPRCAFLFGVGGMPESLRGIGRGLRRSGGAVKKGGAVLAGLAIALALLCILVPLLIRADAAFAGVMALLPKIELGQVVATLFVGVPLAVFFYARAVALRHGRGLPPSVGAARRGLAPLTVVTALAVVAAVYLVYLISQLGYLSGGFAGILPEGYTRAEYARRGFFEMALLCAMNLGIIALAVGLVKKEGRAPQAVRLLCLFIGLVTLFLTAASSAKMVFYIQGYGLTRLRVLTQVITVFLGIATLFVMIWLFVPKMPYMKGILLAALLLGAAVSWADVDTVVARYNVTAYQSGALASVDVAYLAYDLGSGAVPYLVQLTEDRDPEVAAQAREAISNLEEEAPDLRGWNWADWAAREALEDANLP